ncbi:tRNA adenosine(34) deaminase TadA [Peptoniphilaceae bacterium SGI.131]
MKLRDKLLRDENFMRQALLEAKKAEEEDEVPVGAVIVYKGEIIARGHNTVEASKHSFEHAEINAIREASDKLGSWRLEGATMYVTLEPCAMCAGALVLSRIERLVIGASDQKRGFAGSVISLVDDPIFNHQIEVEKGVLEEECSRILSDFFKKKRGR